VELIKITFPWGQTESIDSAHVEESIRGGCGDKECNICGSWTWTALTITMQYFKVCTERYTRTLNDIIVKECEVWCNGS
jgi:hypothetical protein